MEEDSQVIKIFNEFQFLNYIQLFHEIYEKSARKTDTEYDLRFIIFSFE